MPDLIPRKTVRAGAVALLSAGLLISTPLHAQNRTSPPEGDNQALNLDTMLLQEAIQRGIAELEMARLAETRAEAEPVRAFAKRMLEEHGRLNERLTQAARTIGVDIPTGPNENEAAVIERLKTLQGAAFDEVYSVGVAQEHMRHFNLYARMAGYASEPELRQIGKEVSPVLEQHQVAAQALRVDIRPIAQGPLGAAPEQAVEPSKMTPQREQAPYSDKAEGAEP